MALVADKTSKKQPCARYDSLARRILLPEFRFQRVHFTGHVNTHLAPPLQEFVADPLFYRNFPVIIQGNGEPWDIGNLYLVHKLQTEINYESRTYRGIADHLLDYLRFSESEGLDIFYFPVNDRLKITYRYRQRLIDQAVLGQIGLGTGTARINAVVKFYREIMRCRLVDENFLGVEPFKDVYKYISTLNNYGIASAVKVQSHNLAIKSRVSSEPDRISDGGKLRPLDVEDQEIVLKFLLSSSREYQLMFYFALFTGARIQTVCTLRISSLSGPLDKDGMLRLKIGMGTGVDTKSGKRMVLLVPGWLVNDLKIYSKCEDSLKRQSRSFYRDAGDNYLFLSKNGNPYYTSKTELLDRREVQRYGSGGGGHNADLAPLQDGAAIRQFITEILLPKIYLEHADFQKFTFHDLRASFGINLLESELDARGEGRTTEVLEYVQQRLGHSDKKTTLQYLNYKSRLKWRASVQGKYESRLFKYVNTSAVSVVAGVPSDL